MKKNYSPPVSEKGATATQSFFNTLAQNGTAFGDEVARSSGKLVFGTGADLSDKEAWKMKAKRKTVTRLLVLYLIQVAEKKGATDRVKSYWNTFHCMERFYSSNGRAFTKYCKNRHCLLCNSIRKAVIINRYCSEILTWEDPHFVTLTQKAVPVGNLERWFFGVNKAFRQIIDKYKKRNRRGKGIKLMGIKTLECNFNPITQTYNPHLHLIVPNAEIAEILIMEWQKKWNQGKKKLASPLAQYKRRVEKIERDLVETIKYGAKIFTDPEMKKKGKRKIPPMIYAAALDNIFAAMKPYHLFSTFGFNLPKQPKQSKQPPILLEQVDEWLFDPMLYDWLNPETGELFAGYIPPPQLQWILEQNFNTDLE